jgi:hypothetical protein
MDGGESGGQHRLADYDVIEFGSARPRSRWRPAWLALAVLLAAGLVLARVHREGAPARSPVHVTDVGHRLLGVRSEWDLFGLAAGELIRIQLAVGQITRTAVPGLQAAGPVYLVAGPDRAVIRPLDLVPGYLVIDGQPASRLPAVLSHGGFAGPGPGPGQAWVLAAGSDRLSLVSLATGATRMSVQLPPIPSGSAWLANADGRGGVLVVNNNDSLYDAGTGGVRLLTDAEIVAVGPTRWLTTRCAPNGPCANEVTTFPAWTRRALPGPVISTSGSTGPVISTSGSTGVISPDGSLAAVFEPSAAGQPVLQLIDLRTGATRVLPIMVQGVSGSPALAWSPDSRWLFTVAVNGQLRAIDVAPG